MSFAIFLFFGLIAAHKPKYEHLNVNVSTPTNNAPLNTELAYYKLNGTNGPSNQLTHSFIPVSCGAILSVHHTEPWVFSDAGTLDRPILLLNHGYPQSSYIWRYITPEISKRVPVIVPDRPGYGLSTVCPNGTDERTNAGAILDLVIALYGKNKTVVLGGHDRGARSMHRAAVDIGQGGFPDVNAIGLWLADIVPIVEEYKSFVNPSSAVNYFHWSFLPKVVGSFSLDVIMAYGGGNWVSYILAGAKIPNDTSIALFEAGDAVETYHTFFDQISVTNASINDYTSGATTDYAAELADQAAGYKVKIPTHVEYSVLNLVTLGGFDVNATWSAWVDPSAGLTTEGICCGQGHFIVEMAPTESVGQLNRFLDRLGVKGVP